MRLIERPRYLNELKNSIDTPDIKVITGIRRCGKSKLLLSFIEFLSTLKDINIIHINFNLLKYEEFKDYHKLHNYIEENYVVGKKNIVCIDEIQQCPSFELAINSIHASEKYDIYITGSNAFLLSSDLATLFTGRTIEIKVYPFSFQEYLDYFRPTDIYSAFESYLKAGGMAGSYIYHDEPRKYQYILEVFNTMIIRDLKTKYKIRNANVLDDVINFMLDNVSNITSIRNIESVLTHDNVSITDKTINKYINYLCNAFVLYKVRRYDIHGKKYLTSSDKYYLADHSFKYAKLGTRNMDYGRMYENIVAIELLRRGYEVYVGILSNKEIDFVAIRKNEKIYIQVSDNISNESTFNREVMSLLKINDAYPKILLANTRHEEYQYEGIRIIDITSWLCNIK